MSQTIYGPTHLDREIERFQPADRESASGRRSEILIKTDDLRVVLVTMQANASLAEHTAPGTITIQVLSGEMSVEAEGAEHILGVGGFVSLAAGVRHSVRARQDGAFLLTIAWHGHSGD
jgi:quercetin dioxygenase-like cupin family protein